MHSRVREVLQNERKHSTFTYHKGGVGKFPTDSDFFGYLQISDKGTRQISDSSPISKQISDSIHIVWWEKNKSRL